MKFILNFLSILVCFHTLSNAQEVPVEIITNWNAPAKPSLAADYPNEDAIVLFDREYKEFHTTFTNNMLSVIPVESCHRKIKINSQSGFEDFVDVYVPLLQDALDEVIIVDIKGRTIKKNGEVHNVKSDFIKETTLPANVPFLYGYKGKVKQFVFQNIEIGDEIEYYYTITYKYGYPLAFLSYESTTIVNPDYITLESKSTVYTDKRFKFRSFSENSTKFFTRKESDGKIVYELLVQNPAVNKDELFDNDSYSRGSVYYNVSYYEAKTPDNWDDFFKELSSKVKGRRDVMTDALTISQIAGYVDKKTTISDKVKTVFDYINQPLEEDTLKLFKLLKFVNYADYYDAQQYVLLLKKMGIASNIIMLKDKADGIINKDNIYYQFDDIMIEYTTEDAKNHYIPIYKPHSSIDDIDYKFQNTTAIRVDPSTYKTEFITVPFTTGTTVYTAKYTFGISAHLNHKSPCFSTKTTECSGAYEQADRYTFLREYKDTSSKAFSKTERSKLLSNYQETKIKKIALTSISNNTLKWSSVFTHEISLGGASNSISIPINAIIEENYNLGYLDKTKRTENIYFIFPFTKKMTYDVTIPAEYVFVENKFLNIAVKNAAGYFTCKYRMVEPSRIEVQYEFSLAKEIYTAAEWPLVAELFDNAYIFQQQKLAGIRK